MIFYDLLRNAILPLEEIDKNLPKDGKIFDLGCGEGVISNYLSRNKKRFVVAIDSNERRLPKNESKNIIFKKADIRKVSVGEASGIVISDVLHHLDKLDQEKLLVKIAMQLKRRGILIIKEIDSSEKIRSRLSRVWDLILYPSDKISYWKSSDLKKFLENLGFRVEIIYTSRFFPGSTTLFICKK